MLNLVLPQKILNEVRGQLCSPISDYFFGVSKFVKLIIPYKFSYFLLAFYLHCFCFSPLCQVISANYDILLLSGWWIDRSKKFHAPLVKWLKIYLRVQRNLIPLHGFPHPLALVTPAGVSSGILVKGRPIVSCLQKFVSNSLCRKVASTWVFMTCREDIKKFFLPHTYP